MKKTLLFLHHTGVDSPKPQFDSVNTYHKKKGFPKSKLGFYCGYTYLVETSGDFVKAREEDEMGSHTYVKGKTYNEDGIGVCLAGNGKFTDWQLRVLVALCSGIVARHDIKPENILNHYDIKRTSCPGRDLAGYVREALGTAPEPSWLSFASLSLPEKIKRTRAALKRATGNLVKDLQRRLNRLLKP